MCWPLMFSAPIWDGLMTMTEGTSSAGVP